MSTSSLQSFLDKPRVFVLSDISNEPDDAESLVRFLLYSNQFDIEGIVAVTSTWMKTKVCPQDMHRIIDGYAGVVENLNNHTHPDHPYPTAETLRSLVKSGPPVLLTIKEKYPADQAASLRAKLRVYTISDQDDTSAWIRAEFPDVFYISSVHAWNQYGLAAWTGIAGDRYYGFDQGGPDFSKMTKSWIKKNIQVGPLGSTYPDYIFIPEGDTPTFLYIIQNGLGVREHPEYGSWGGRYALTDLSGEGLSGRHYSDTTDAVVGADGKTYTSDQATIWRWRDMFQNDFASRIQWSLNPDFKAANHHPVLCVNDSWGHEALELEIEAGEDIVFDASSSHDPDGDSLSFKWWQYKEPTATQWLVRFEVSNLEIENLEPDARRVKVRIPPPEQCCFDRFTTGSPVTRGQLLHLVLEVTDSAGNSLSSSTKVSRIRRSRQGPMTSILGALFFFLFGSATISPLSTMARPSLASPNITITRPSTPFAPSPLPPPNPLTHADEILAQFSKLTRSTSWRLVSKIPFEGELWEPEGIAKVGTDRYFVSAGEYTVPTRKFPDGKWEDGTDRTAGAGFGHIVVFDGQGQRIADATLSEKGSTEYHLGGIDYDGEFIWATLSEYRPNSTATVLRLSPATLQHDTLFRVGDHQGGIVHDPSNRTLTTLNWGGREGSIWSLDKPAPLSKFASPERRVTNPSHWIDYQDCKFLGHAKAYEDRAVMLCSGIAKVADGVEVGGVAIVDAQTLEPLMEVPITMRTDHGVLVTKNPVDVDVVDGRMQLYFLPEEGHSTLHVYEAE
ncbi:hypothetical protein BN1708_014679 [Verticillium longisporum]|uniref:DUF1593 domain-containing protein n=1 Tax=Verticillium longisporum TaxID=100787 RepID=A0A0G4LYX4_VERLO|nr:hypothetical protein BN1708_014679 [Verticillium longisporum]